MNYSRLIYFLLISYVSVWGNSSLNFKYVLPEIIADGSSETLVTLLNPDSSLIEVEVVAFSAEGVELGLSASIQSLGPREKVLLRISEAFPNQTPAWIQVGCSGECDIFAAIHRDKKKTP